MFVERYHYALVGRSGDRMLGFLSHAGDWAWALAAKSGRHGGTVSVPKYWHSSQVELTLPARLDHDPRLRRAFAEELMAVPAPTLMAQVADWVRAAPGPHEYL